MPILGENNNSLDNFRSYENEDSTLEEQNIKKDNRNLVDKGLDTRSYARNSLSRFTL